MDSESLNSRCLNPKCAPILVTPSQKDFCRHSEAEEIFKLDFSRDVSSKVGKGAEDL